MERSAALIARPAQSNRVVSWLLPAGFLAVAGWLVFLSPGSEIPLDEPAIIDAASIAPGPRRRPLSDPAHMLIGGDEQRCNGCHQIFASRKDRSQPPTYHTEIVLNHGLNTDCLNCHHPENREALRRLDGSEVPLAMTPETCAGCHGTVYRDWQHGTHGKTMGSWQTGSDAQLRLTCNECHDPHSPAYPKYAPLPGPNTLRMGEPGASGAVHDEKHRPLRMRLRGVPARDPTKNAPPAQDAPSPETTR